MKTKHTAQSGLFALRSLLALFFCTVGVCAMITGTPLAFWRPDAQVQASQRTLTFAERVAYQRAIEDVYWRHRIWPKENAKPKPLLDAVISQAQIESKVQDYLRNSQVLDHYWQHLITAEQLQAEMDRMAQHTKQPEVLRELFEALGNDPIIIAECVARPALVERLMANLDRRDQKQLGSSRPKAKTQVPREVAAIDSIARAVQVNRPYHLPRISEQPSGCVDNWAATSTINAPTGRY